MFAGSEIPMSFFRGGGGGGGGLSRDEKNLCKN